ncbi:hypothetical protein LPJ56_007353, partial [Coemansia sp. RSA 2599]
RPLGVSALPTPLSATFALSASAVENEHLANYSLHVVGGDSHSEKVAAAENGSSQSPSSAELLASAGGVPSPPHSQRSATATST